MRGTNHGSIVLQLQSGGKMSTFHAQKGTNWVLFTEVALIWMQTNYTQKEKKEKKRKKKKTLCPDNHISINLLMTFR